MNMRLSVLTAVAALLAGYLAVEGLGVLAPGRTGETPVTSAVAPRAAAVQLNPLQDLDPDAFAAIVEKPLFNPSRLPRPAEPVPPPPPVEPQPVAEPPPPLPQGPGPEDYKLLGVASGPEGRIAAVRLASGEVVYLRKGESVDNWSVIDVGDRTVAIGTPENAVTYGMFSNADAGAGEDDQSDGGGGGDGGIQPQPQPLPLPLPLPMPVPQQPKPQPGQPPLPQQFTVPSGAGG